MFNRHIFKTLTPLRLFLLILISLFSGIVSCGENDSNGMANSMKSSDNLTWRVAYDKHKRYAAVIDPAGKQTRFNNELDHKGRLRRQTKVLADSSQVIYDYDHLERRISMTDRAGTVKYEYDGFGQLICVKRERMPAVNYSYDSVGRIVALRVGSTYTVEYSYDFLGRPSRMRTPAGDIQYEYQAGRGMIIRTLPNGVRTLWEFAPDGSLRTITHVSGDNRVLAQFTYTYRAEGLISEVQEWTELGERWRRYGYDKVQRLVEYSDSQTGSIRYSYDRLGNRKEVRPGDGEVVSTEYDWAGRMINHGGQECTYDAAGNLTSYFKGGEPTAFDYTAENLLKAANNGRVEYNYDGDGYLISRNVDGKRIDYVPNPLSDIWNPLIASQNDGTQTFYIWEGNTPLAVISEGEVQFYLHDYLGSVTNVIDHNGNVLNFLDYDPFGQIKSRGDDVDLQPGYAGFFFDPLASVYLTRARAYSPDLGRFLQVDPEHRVPLGSQKDLNNYVYCGNDPVNFVDQNGATPHWVWGAQNWAWQVFHNFGSLFDYGYAKQFYAWKSEQSLVNAQNMWTGGLQATMWDLIGGYIPGEAANRGQALAQILWSIAPGVKSGSSVLQGLSFGRTFGSSIINVSRQDYSAAALDIIGMGGTWMGLKANDLRSTPILLGSQYEFPFLSKAVTKAANTYETGSKWIDALGLAGQAGEMASFLADEYAPARSTNQALSPSNVGGVYLRGAGKALAELGQLVGIAVDEQTGKLILISRDEGEVGLPPLRMDDVVTVFRGVYQHGDAPYVSIDPNPANPHGSTMLIRHGPGTENTYVGWVLFEADRLMKAYSLGTDNATKRKIVSRIRSYQSLVDLGFSNHGNTQRNSIWERFWIVPAEVKRRKSKSQQLTLLDVPLKVKTERMELRNGKLVPAQSPTPSKEAAAFSKWFTNLYGKIAIEALSKSPLDAGKDSSLSPFEELRRIALIAAIAENLRDQGVPLPSWMRHYEVNPCPMPATTPAISVSETKSGRELRIYGGVSLSPSDKAVHTVVADREAEAIDMHLFSAVAKAPLLSPVSISLNGKKYKALALPGNDTRNFGACTLQERDLAVPVAHGFMITLGRKFNSFFQTSDVFGNSWILDLPKLEAQPLPLERKGDETQYTTIYQLTSPLNTYSGYFRKYEFVEEANGQLLVPDETGQMLGIADLQDDRVGFPTKVVLFRDGRRWHFDNAGEFVAVERDGLAAIYRRDQSKRIQRIEGWYGKYLLADIRLYYDGSGRLELAAGSNHFAVKYNYDDQGNLSRVESPSGTLEYAYRNGFVSKITLNNTVIREFTYSQNGELLEEKMADGERIKYTTHFEQGNYRVRAFKIDDPTQALESAEYDAALRPVRKIFGDGTTAQWEYTETAIKTDITLANGQQFILQQSLDGRKKSIKLPDGGIYETEHNKAGRLLKLRQNSRVVLRQIWHEDGKLARIISETAAYHPHYGEDGVQTSFYITPPEEQGPKLSRWLNVEYNEWGYAKKITDYTGLEMQLGYDKNSEVTAVATSRGGISAKRDDQGKITSIETSWGYKQKHKYDRKKHTIEEIKIENGNETSTIRFDNGRLTGIKQFDGGEFVLKYDEPIQKAGSSLLSPLDRILASKLKEVRTPNDLKFTYAYDKQDQISAIKCEGLYKINFFYDQVGTFIGVGISP